MLDPAKKTNLKDAVNYSDKSIVSQIVQKNNAGNITLFAFDKGEELSEHTAPFDAFVQVLEGQANIIIDGKNNHLMEGESILMPANIPHALYAEDKFKMLLTMIKNKD